MEGPEPGVSRAVASLDEAVNVLDAGTDASCSDCDEATQDITSSANPHNYNVDNHETPCNHVG